MDIHKVRSPFHSGPMPLVVRWWNPCAHGTSANLVGSSAKRWIEMAKMGLPTSHGFTITREAFKQFLKNGNRVTDHLLIEVKNAISEIEQATGTTYNSDCGRPLAFNIDFISNIRPSLIIPGISGFGMNERNARHLGKLTADPRFAWTQHLNSIESFGSLILEAAHGEKAERDPFVFELDSFSIEKHGHIVPYHCLSISEIRSFAKRYKKVIQSSSGNPYPEDPDEQSRCLIHSSFSLFISKTATIQGKSKRLVADPGFAIDFRMMTFGNTGKESGTGVFITRDPISGDRKCIIDFRSDTHSSLFTPNGNHQVSSDCPISLSLELNHLSRLIEKVVQNACSVSFTVERGNIFIEKVHRQQLTSVAALRMTNDMVRERIMTEQAAVAIVDPLRAKHLLGSKVNDSPGALLATGAPASEGVAAGRIYFDAKRAMRAAARGEAVLLALDHFRPHDENAASRMSGLVSVRGGLSSIGGSMGRHELIPCICGISGMEIDLESRSVTISGIRFQEGSVLTIDGGSGHIRAGDCSSRSDIHAAIAVGCKRARRSQAYKDFVSLMSWCYRLKKTSGHDYPFAKVDAGFHTMEDILRNRLMHAKAPHAPNNPQSITKTPAIPRLRDGMPGFLTTRQARSGSLHRGEDLEQ